MVKMRAAIGSWAGLGYRPGRDDTWHSRHMIVRYSCCRGEAGQVAAAAAKEELLVNSPVC